jgi:hypothetical protein
MKLFLFYWLLTPTKKIKCNENAVSNKPLHVVCVVNTNVKYEAIQLCMH